MTDKEVIEILENERQCVINAATCDRDCLKCPLVMDEYDILKALNIAKQAVAERSKRS